MTDPTFSSLLSARQLAASRLVTRGFYQRPTEQVARGLLGKLLVRATPDGVVAVRLTELEAYLGPVDPACHTAGGRRTARVRSMWGEAGHAYVYLIYGVHHCLNVVTVGAEVGEAVLVRGGVPVHGRELIRRRRGPRVPERSLCDGPGRLCQALAVTRADDGHDLCAGLRLWLADDGRGVEELEVQRLPRVGVEHAGAAASWPLRFALVSPISSPRRR